MTNADKPAFAQAFARLAIALREKEPDAVTMKVYFESLLGHEIEFVVAAAARLISADYFPKVGEWRAMARTVEAERVTAQRALLRKLVAPLCEACGDTGWERDGDQRVHRCDCATLRRLEVLGRRPWPTVTETARLTDGTDNPITREAAPSMIAMIQLRTGRVIEPRVQRDR